MRNLTIILISLFLASCAQRPDAITGATQPTQKNNSVYHSAELTKLKSSSLAVGGEVEKAGIVDFSKFYKHEIIIKEATSKGSDSLNFVGAYRYVGYSLFDILNSFLIKKKNEIEFKPQIDLYVLVENDKGESIVFSWAEIFNSAPLHQVLIATEVAPIKPHKVEVNYPISSQWKIVVGGDFLTYRHLENPTKITVKSFDKKQYKIEKGMGPAFSQSVNVLVNNEFRLKIEATPKRDDHTKYHSNFYGMGKGYHNLPVLQGIDLQTAMSEVLQTMDNSWLQKGLVCCVGVDGYRVIYSYSELFNRTDQMRAILSIPDNPSQVGHYRFYHPANFWADYSVKGLSEIYIFKE